MPEANPQKRNSRRSFAAALQRCHALAYAAQPGTACKKKHRSAHRQVSTSTAAPASARYIRCSRCNRTPGTVRTWSAHLSVVPPSPAQMHRAMRHYSESQLRLETAGHCLPAMPAQLASVGVRKQAEKTEPCFAIVSQPPVFPASAVRGAISLLPAVAWITHVDVLPCLVST